MVIFRKWQKRLGHLDAEGRQLTPRVCPGRITRLLSLEWIVFLGTGWLSITQRSVCIYSLHLVFALTSCDHSCFADAHNLCRLGYNYRHSRSSEPLGFVYLSNGLSGTAAVVQAKLKHPVCDACVMPGDVSLCWLRQSPLMSQINCSFRMRSLTCRLGIIPIVSTQIERSL